MSTRFVVRHRVSLVSVVVVFAAVIALVAYALEAVGFDVQHADLNDGGVWVSGSPYGAYARLNKPVGQFDGAVTLGASAESHDLDIVQDGAAVFAFDRTAGKLTALDGATMSTVPGQSAVVPADASVEVGGSNPAVLAVADPKSGRVWATTVDTSHPTANLGAVDGTAKPVAKIGAGAQVAVGSNGAIFVAASDGTLTTITTSGGRFTKGPSRTLGSFAHPPFVAAVGTTPVVFDQTHVWVGTNAPVTFPDIADAVLQQSSVSGSAAVLTTPGSVVQVPLAGGRPAVSAADGNGGRPVEPIQLDGCIYSAWWGAAASYRTTCAASGTDYHGSLDVAASDALTFRVNRHEEVLNDGRSGKVWNVDGKSSLELDHWDAVRPRQSHTGKKSSDASGQSKPPHANPDTEDVRAGRSSVLHVLDNDTRPPTDTIAIISTTQPAASGYHVAISGDEQTLAVSVPAGATGDTTFQYSITGSNDPTATTATVTLHVVAAGTDTPPHRCACATNTPWTVGATSKLEIPVLGDWRDDENDPLTIRSATASTGQVAPTSDGELIYTAPATGTSATITYVVDDGYGKTATETLRVTILPTDSLKGVPPIAQPDVAQGLVGQPITIQPLANDLPGADPTTDNPQLALASVTKLPGTTTEADLTTGTVTFTGLTARTYKVPYGITYGAQSATGFIRIDVRPRTRAAQGVVALPDTAVLHGNTPSLVDVLANDYDQAGALLAVQSAQVETPNVGMTVSVTNSRYLHLVNTEDTVAAHPVTVSYVVSDGTSTATGEVSVVEQPAGAPDQPVALPDSADVRVGDSVAIPVLQNDIDPAGGQLSIQPGSVTSPGGASSAFVSGSNVLFIAPPTGASGTATFDYVVTNGIGSDTGTVTVHIHALPRTPADNLPPDPGNVTATTTAGGRIVVHLPTSGVDPDGDSVTFAGITQPGPALGMVLATTSNTLTYEAFPSSTNLGTDTIGYRMQDRFGAIGTGQIRIAVLSPGQAQPPIAVDDTIHGAPHARLAVNVVANDLVSAGDSVTIKVIDGPRGTQVDPANNHVIDVAAPANGQLAVVDYQISDGVSDPSTAKLTVIGENGWDNPPVAVDDQATLRSPAADYVDVPVLKNDYDPDRGDTPKIAKVLAATATPDGSSVRIKLTAAPQTVPYEITDGRKTAVALIFVPASRVGAPYVRPGSVIAVPAKGSRTFDINQYVIDPNGKQVQTTFVGTQTAAPGSAVTVKAAGRSVTLVGTGTYTGPGALTLQVTDGVTPATKNAVTGWVTIPLQVGRAEPVLRCPTDDDRALYQGGRTEHLLLTHYCNVWTPQSMGLSSVRFTADWSPTIAGVEKSMDGQTLTLVPTRNAHAGESGAVAVGVVGSTQKQLVHYQVLKVGLATVTPMTVNAREGKPVTVDVAPHVSTQIGDPSITVLKCSESTTGTAPATCAADHGRVTITPAASARGPATFTLQITDVPGDATRTVTGTVAMTVIGKPAAVSSVTAYPDRVKGSSVRLAWPAPAYDGGISLDGFYVSYSGAPAGGHRCEASGCIITGLSNGRSYVFRVRTHNAADEYSDGEGTPSNPAKPDTKPLAPASVSVAPAGDGKLMVSWSAATNNGSPLTGYYLQIAGPDRSGAAQPVGLGLSKLVTGLTNNDQYHFRVAARNGDGTGPFSAASGAVGQSAGRPGAVGAPSVPAEQPTSPQPTVSVHVTWNQLASQDYNGGPIKYYSVYRRTQGAAGWGSPLPNCAQVPPSVAACDDTVNNDGTTWEYSVTATNTTTPDGGGMESLQGPASAFKAVGLPDAPTNVEVFASQAASTTGTPDPGPTGGSGPGFDQALKVQFTVPNANGAALTAIEYSLNGGAFQTLQSSSLAPGSTATGTISGLTNGTGYTVALRARNESNAGPPSSTTAAEYPYGAPTVPTATASNNGNVVTYSWSGGSNGRPVASYLVNIDGSGFVDKGAQPGSEQHDRGYAASYSLVVYVVDSAGQRSADSPVASGRTPDVPAPSQYNCNGTNGLTLVYNWNNVGNGLTYQFAWNGGGWQNNGGSTSTTQTGANYSTNYGIAVRATDGRSFSSTLSFSCATGPPPMFRVRHEGPGSCSNINNTCEKVDVGIINFPPGGSASCYAGGVGANSWSATRTAGPDGTSVWDSSGSPGYLFDTSGSQFTDGNFALGQDANGLTCK